MINNLSKQSQTKTYKDFSTIVKEYLKIKGVTPSELINTHYLSKTIVSRIYRNTNSKGSKYVPTHKVFMTICIALKLTQAEAQELFFAAFPEMELLGYFLDNKLDIDRANEILDYNKFELLGNTNK